MSCCCSSSSSSSSLSCQLTDCHSMWQLSYCACCVCVWANLPEVNWLSWRTIRNCTAHGSYTRCAFGSHFVASAACGGMPRLSSKPSVSIRMQMLTNFCEKLPIDFCLQSLPMQLRFLSNTQWAHLPHATCHTAAWRYQFCAAVGHKAHTQSERESERGRARERDGRTTNPETLQFYRFCPAKGQ